MANIHSDHALSEHITSFIGRKPQNFSTEHNPGNYISPQNVFGIIYGINSRLHRCNFNETDLVWTAPLSFLVGQSGCWNSLLTKTVAYFRHYSVCFKWKRLLCLCPWGNCLRKNYTQHRKNMRKMANIEWSKEQLRLYLWFAQMFSFYSLNYMTVWRVCEEGHSESVEHKGSQK